MFLAMGAEATIELRDGMIIKKRLPKGYRLKALDSTIRQERTRDEGLDALDKLALVMWLSVGVYEDVRKVVEGLG